MVMVASQILPHRELREDRTRCYYSAYIWVAFVLCDEAGRPLHDEPWRNLLTFFEHGNLAEPNTYEALKLQLAAKVHSSLDLILKRQKHITVRYACAIDDCGCGRPIACSPPKGQAIKDLLFKNHRRLALVHHDRFAHRIVPTGPAAPHDIYSACQLSEIVDRYKAAISTT